MNCITLLPNILSSLRIILSPVFAVLFLHPCYKWQLLGVIVFTLAALTDTCDGYLARRFGAMTRWGAFLDPLADKLLVTAGLGCLWWYGAIAWWFLAAIIARDLFVTVMRMHVVQGGRVFTTSWLAKLKTVVQFGSMYVGFYAVLWPGAAVHGLLQVIMPTVALFTLYTGLDYWRRVTGRR